MSARLGSFRHAIRGLLILVREEHNAWVHLAGTLLVILGGFFWEISKLEWCMVVFAIGLVWSAEALNTAIEYLADVVCVERNDRIGRAKDLAAAGVLLASLTAAVIGLLVFGPRLFG